MALSHVYLIKNFILCSINAITEGFNPSLLVLRCLSLEFNIMDLWMDEADNSQLKLRWIIEQKICDKITGVLTVFLFYF